MLTSLIVAAGNEATMPLAQGGGPEIPWVRITLVLILCVGLAVVAVGFVRLRHGYTFLPSRQDPTDAANGKKTNAERLAIIERVSAGPASQFVVLARGKQRYLLHLSQQGVSVIDRFCEEKADTEQ